MDDLTTDKFEAAKARGDALMRGPRAVSAHYDAGRHRVIVRLTTGVELGLAPRDVEGLDNASSDALKAIEIDARLVPCHRWFRSMMVVRGRVALIARHGATGETLDNAALKVFPDMPLRDMADFTVRRAR